MSRVALPLIVASFVLASCSDADGDSGGDGVGDTFDAGEAETSEGETGTSDATSGETGGEPIVPELGSTFTVIGTAADGLDGVRDLEFDPAHPERLWTFNTNIHGVVILFEPGTAQQSAEVRVDTYAQHFMAYVSAAAFGDNGNFASCQESRDEWNVGPQPPDDFMGPTLWSADLDIFAMVGQDFPPGAQEGSHLDMLHQSPLCMGIAHESGNAFWASDGLRGNLVHYDFVGDHGPGGSDHSDGIITRYADATITRVANVPGHMEFDHDTGMLWVADTGAGRIMRLDPSTGTNVGSLPGEWDGAEYTGVEGADYVPVIEGLANPCGLVLDAGRLFVSENATGDVIAFDLAGNELDRMQTPAQNLMGITLGPDGHLYYADPVANEVVRVDE
jgi:hypothetical protein